MENLNNQDRQLIERYVDGLLTPEEQAAFTQRCQTDTVFADELAAFQMAVVAVKTANRAQLKAQLTQHVQKNTLKRRTLLRGWIVGLAAAASLLIGWFFIRGNAQNPSTPEEAFQTAFQAAPSGGIEKSTTTQLTLLDSAYLAYDNQQWQMALPLFDKINDPKPKTLFLKANAFMALKDVDNALPILKELNSNPQFSERKEEIDWLIALCFLKKADASYLKRISEIPNHLFAMKAKVLLKQLE
jgi:thioredoxin-like negative regulator of GroEL